MHGHMPPQQHPGIHPAHQPPPHLTHLTSLPPHSMQRDHPANRLNNARHHHPRGVDHQAAGMAPHLSMQVPPPPPHQPPHQSQNGRKPPGPSYYNLPAGMPKSMPLSTPHLHPSPPGLGVGPQPPQALPPPPHQQHMGSISLPPVVSGNHPPGPGGKLSYGMGGGGGGGGAGGSAGGAQVSMHHSVTMQQAPPPIPVVSAATPAGTKTRHIPSSTDHKVHHHSHNVLQSNGNCGPGSKGIANHHQTSQSGATMDKMKGSSGNVSSAGNRHHHNHHQHQQQHQQQQHQPQQQQQQQQQQPQQQPSIVSKPNDAPLQKDASAVIAVAGSAPSTAPSVAPTGANQAETAASTAATTAANGGASSMASGAEPTAGQQPQSPTDSIEALANIKEKTTMCLVNELARYNKIQHQYRLTGESGPAHKKHFTVMLKLGDEEYTAEGASIKKAQHKAAGDAIAATKYKHPPARTNRRTKTGTKGNVSSFTPTVELNALAMKRGEPTVYTVKAVPVPASKYGGPANGGAGGVTVPPSAVAGGGRRPVEEKLAPNVAHPYGGAGRYSDNAWGRAAGPAGVAGAGVGGRGGMGGFHPGHQQQQQHHHHQHGHHPRDDHANRHHAPHSYHHGDGYGHHHGPAGPVPAVQEFYKATLRVGERTFLGEGHTPQAARHDAAARALEVLKPLTMEGAEGKAKAGDASANGDAASSSDGTSVDGLDPNAELKSPISLVHEIAVQRSLSVVFEVISEKGPPHMTVFVTQCKVGTIVTEGEGTGKKLSKKRAAEKMLEELRKLQKAEQQLNPSPWGEGSPGGQGGEKRKSNAKAAPSATADGATAKKKARNLIKEKSVADVAEKENPISRLMQIQQARKEKQPVYTLQENDRPAVGRRRQFTIEVSAGGRQATGVGMTKKAAKWNAAEALLIELGFTPSEAKAGAPSGGDGASANKENQSGAANDSSPTGGKRSRKVRFQEDPGNSVPTATPAVTVANGANQVKAESTNDSMNDSIASNDSMGTNSSGVSSTSSVAPKADIGAKKEQLLYLAQLLKFEVQFSDFPKGNHGEYLTLVILSTEPPQLCHGSGASLQESHDEAARGALEILSKIGLHNVKPKAPAGSAPDDTAATTA